MTTGHKMADCVVVTVCSSCLRASCWQGSFYCENHKLAGTKGLPIWQLRKLKREDPGYWN